MRSSRGNIKLTSYNAANEVIDELFESLCLRCQGNLETSMRGINFIFDSVQLMYYKCHKVNFKRGGSDIDSLDWIKEKKATINLKNADDKCFQYAVTVTLNYEEIKRDPQRISKIKPFINKCKWRGINYPSKIDDRKMFEKNNPTILFLLSIKEKEILPAYISNLLKTNNSIKEVR